VDPTDIPSARLERVEVTHWIWDIMEKACNIYTYQRVRRGSCGFMKRADSLFYMGGGRPVRGRVIVAGPVSFKPLHRVFGRGTVSNQVIGL
jgi:hypothetical protein